MLTSDIVTPESADLSNRPWTCFYWQLKHVTSAKSSYVCMRGLSESLNMLWFRSPGWRVYITHQFSRKLSLLFPSINQRTVLDTPNRAERDDANSKYNASVSVLVLRDQLNTCIYIHTYDVVSLRASFWKVVFCLLFENISVGSILLIALKLQ